jgi:hypothetical protein
MNEEYPLSTEPSPELIEEIEKMYGLIPEPPIQK